MPAIRVRSGRERTPRFGVNASSDIAYGVIDPVEFQQNCRDRDDIGHCCVKHITLARAVGYWICRAFGELRDCWRRCIFNREEMGFTAAGVILRLLIDNSIVYGLRYIRVFDHTYWTIAACNQHPLLEQLDTSFSGKECAGDIRCASSFNRLITINSI